MNEMIYNLKIYIKEYNLYLLIRISINFYNSGNQITSYFY